MQHIYSWTNSRRSFHYLQSSVVQSLLFTTEFDFLWLFSLPVPWYVRYHSWEDDQRLNSKTSSCQLFHLHSLVVTGVKSKNLRWHPRSYFFSTSRSWIILFTFQSFDFFEVPHALGPWNLVIASVEWVAMSLAMRFSSSPTGPGNM